MERKLIFLTGFIIIFSILTSTVYGKELVYSLDMIVFKDDNVDLRNLTAIYGYPGEFSEKETDYVIKIFEDNSELFNANIRISFLLSLDPIGVVESNSTFVHFNVPYFEDAENIALYHSGEKILDIELNEEFCDKNGSCDLGENENNCPEDCLEVEDVDEEEGGFPWVFLGIVLVILIVIILIFLVTKKSKKKDNFKSLKQKWG